MTMKNLAERRISKSDQATQNLKTWAAQFDPNGMIEVIGDTKEKPADYNGGAIMAVLLQLFLSEITAKLEEHFNRN